MTPARRKRINGTLSQRTRGLLAYYTGPGLLEVLLVCGRWPIVLNDNSPGTMRAGGAKW